MNEGKLVFQVGDPHRSLHCCSFSRIEEKQMRPISALPAVIRPVWERCFTVLCNVLLTKGAELELIYDDPK